MRKHWHTTSYDWQYEAAHSIECTRLRSEAHRQRRRKRLIAWARVGIVWAACFVALAALVVVLWGGR